MISHEEIEVKAEKFEIHVANLERDYVFGWLIFGIFTESSLKDKIFLKGGNALRKGYFENTRFSNDLDFGIPDDIDEKILLDEVNRVCDFVQKKSQINFINVDNKIEEKFTATDSPIPDLKVYEVRVYFKDFQGNAEHLRIKISMDITRFDKVLLPIQSVRLIHPYSDYKKLECEIRCMKLEEIIATKLKCLLQRQHVPDLFDYAYSIKLLGGNLNKEEVVRTLIRKTIFDRNPHVLKDILIKTSFDFFKEYWDKTLICAGQFKLNVDEAILTFTQDLDVLFNIYPPDSYSNFAYFGSNLRVPIMKAGRSQTLLKVVYNGAERMVEPYSLKYLQKRDGTEKEYLYVYNRSGGNSEPGIRCFVSENFQSILNTEEHFNPRNPIELSKAGETPENPYLFDPDKPLRSPKPRRFRPAFRSLKYIFKCNYCGKKFTRQNHINSLRAHTNKNKYPCTGRYGYYVGTKY